jgi:hypothetical protein
MQKLLFIASSILSLQACEVVMADDQQVPLSLEILHESHYNEFGATTPKSAMVLRTEADYHHELLKRSSEPSVALDFSQELVVLIDMGLKPSGGYSIDLDLTEQETVIIMNVTYIFPSDSCSVTLALTNPFQILRLNTQKEVVFNETVKVKQC